MLQIAKVACDSIKITELTDSGITVVKDRGVLDVRADLHYNGFDLSACQGPLIREPDLAVYLRVNEVNRARRLAVKKDVRLEDYQPNIPGNRMYAMTQFVMGEVMQREATGRGVVIHTDGLNIDDVVNQVYLQTRRSICQ